MSYMVPYKTPHSFRGFTANRGDFELLSPSIQDMGGDHRRVHVCVAEPFLNGSDIIAILEYMRGTRVPEGMTG